MSEIFQLLSSIFYCHYLEWKHLLADDKMKQIIISSLQFLVNDRRVKVYGFVIMPNHIYLIWQIQDGHEKAKVQQSFLKYTAQQMKFMLERQ